MSYKLGCKFFLLMLLSMLPILSHSQSVTTCNSSFGNGTISNVGNTGNTVKLVMRTSITLNGKEASCSILPSPVVVIFQGSFGPSVITQNGLTVNFGKVKFINRSATFPAGCGVQGSGTTVFSYNCLPGRGAGFNAIFDVEYLLEGTSNTSVPNTFFLSQALPRSLIVQFQQLILLMAFIQQSMSPYQQHPLAAPPLTLRISSSALSLRRNSLELLAHPPSRNKRHSIFQSTVPSMPCN